MKCLLCFCLLLLPLLVRADENDKKAAPAHGELTVVEEIIPLKILEAETIINWFDLERKMDFGNRVAAGCGRPESKMFDYFNNPYGWPSGRSPYGFPYNIQSLLAVAGEAAVRVKAIKADIDVARKNIEAVDKAGTIILEVVGYKISKQEIEKNQKLAPDIWPENGALTPSQIQRQINGFESLTQAGKKQRSYYLKTRFEMAPRLVGSGQKACFEVIGFGPSLHSFFNPGSNIVDGKPFIFARGLQVTPSLDKNGALQLALVPYFVNHQSLNGKQPGEKDLIFEDRRTITATATATVNEPLLIELMSEPDFLKPYFLKTEKFRYFLKIVPHVARDKKKDVFPHQ